MLNPVDSISNETAVPVAVGVEQTQLLPTDITAALSPPAPPPPNRPSDAVPSSSECSESPSGERIPWPDTKGS